MKYLLIVLLVGVVGCAGGSKHSSRTPPINMQLQLQECPVNQHRVLCRVTFTNLSDKNFYIDLGALNISYLETISKSIRVVQTGTIKNYGDSLYYSLAAKSTRVIEFKAASVILGKIEAGGDYMAYSEYFPNYGDAEKMIFTASTFFSKLLLFVSRHARV